MIDPQESKESTTNTSNDMGDAHCKLVHSSMAQFDISMEDESCCVQSNNKIIRSVKLVRNTSKSGNPARIRRRRCRSGDSKHCHQRRSQQVPQQISVAAEKRHEGLDGDVEDRADLSVNKWSLQRAIWIHGSSQEQAQVSGSKSTSMHCNNFANMDEESRQAAQDVYRAYSVTKQAAQKLELPTSVVNEAVHLLVDYAVHRNGLKMKGIQSMLSRTQQFESNEQRVDLEERLKSYNKLKQISALSAASLFLVAKNQALLRKSTEICACFHPQTQMNACEKVFLKPKHLSRAMLELKLSFSHQKHNAAKNPQDCHSSPTKCTLVSSNFLDQFIQNLHLPPVAEASIHLLVTKYEKDNMIGVEFDNNDSDSATICAALTYFVCSMGDTMQYLAIQLNDKRSGTSDRKRSLREEQHTSYPAKKKPKLSAEQIDDDTETLIDSVEPVAQISLAFGNESEKQAYDMRRMWDAWSEQITWSRDPAEIEQSCSIPRQTLLDVYQKKIFPCRESFLRTLQDSVSSKRNSSTEQADKSAQLLRSAPLASILLGNITSVDSFMKVVEH
jgi:hypothetical protein